MKKNNRTISKIIRFTEQELSIIEQKRERLTFSEYVRNSALHRVNLKFPIKREILFELHKQGVNLNQITKRLNESDKSLTEIAILDAISKTLIKIDEVYQAISKQEQTLKSELERQLNDSEIFS